MTNVVVIGAGVIGTSVAYRIAQAGAKVTVLEAAGVGSGTSGTSFAWTNSNNKPPRAYHDLNVAGMRAHVALREEFADIPWWHGGGSVEWESEEAAQQAQREKVERLSTWGYAAEWITHSQLHALEPDISLATVGDVPIAYYPDEGWLDPVLYAHAMVEAARRHGAQLRTAVRVVDLVLQNGNTAGVKTARGETIHADVVVNCAGRWANDVVRDAEFHIPLAPTVGFLVFTPPVPTSLRRVVHNPLCHVRPDGAGRLMLHRNEADLTLTPEIEPSPILPQAQDLVRRVAKLIPAVGCIRPEAVRLGIRPMPSDGYSVVGQLSSIRGYYVVVTHSGVTLAPFLGRAVASEVMHGRTVPELATFRPNRFFKDA